MRKTQKVKLALWFLWWVLGKAGYAQAPQFTQLYNHPTYHNPALVGEMGHSRATLSHRNQWRGIYNGLGSLRVPFKTTYVSFDTYREEHRWGFGGYCINDQMGKEAQNNVLALQGAYFIPYPFNESAENLESLELGLQSTLYSTQFTIGDNNLGGLRFVDQFTAAGVVGPSVDPFAAFSTISQTSLLFSAGFVYKHFSKRDDPSSTGFTVGLSAHELKGDNYPVRWDGFITYRIKGWELEESFSFTGHYRRSRKAQQIDWLVNYRCPIMDDSPLVGHLGGGFRAMPWRKAADGSQQKDALLLMGGLEWEQFRIAASYDFSTSSLRQRTGNGQQSGGAFEISATYSVARMASKRGSKQKKTSIRGSHFDEKYDPKCEPKKTRMYMAI